MHNLHKYTPSPLVQVKNIPKNHGRQVNPKIPSARLLKKQHSIPAPFEACAIGTDNPTSLSTLI